MSTWLNRHFKRFAKYSIVKERKKSIKTKKPRFICEASLPNSTLSVVATAKQRAPPENRPRFPSLLSLLLWPLSTLNSSPICYFTYPASIYWLLGIPIVAKRLSLNFKYRLSTPLHVVISPFFAT